MSTSVNNTRAQSLLRLLNFRTPGDWQIVTPPPELMWPTALTACLRVGTHIIYAARSDGRRNARWYVRARSGDAMFLWGRIVNSGDSVPIAVGQAAAQIGRHDPTITPLVWQAAR